MRFFGGGVWGNYMYHPPGSAPVASQNPGSAPPPCGYCTQQWVSTSIVLLMVTLHHRHYHCITFSKQYFIPNWEARQCSCSYVNTTLTHQVLHLVKSCRFNNDWLKHFVSLLQGDVLWFAPGITVRSHVMFMFRLMLKFNSAYGDGNVSRENCICITINIMLNFDPRSLADPGGR